MALNPSHDDYNNDIKPDGNCLPLTDSISCIDWAPSNIGPVFVCSFWDGTLRVYEISSNGFSPCIIQKLSTKAKSPLTKCVWSNDAQFIYVGDITGLIQAFNVQTQAFMDVGKHTAAISALHIVPNQNIIISAAY
jgi:WD40 repeat protein